METGRRLSNIPIVVVLAFLASACASPTRFEAATSRTSDYRHDAKRLFVIIRPSEALNAGQVAFQSRLSARLADCGVDSAYFVIPAKLFLSLESDEPLLKEVGIEQRKFQPDTVLKVFEAGSAKTITRSFASSTLTALTVQVDATDLRSGKTVWSGHVAQSGQIDAGAALADQIAAQMQKDGVLNSCPKTTG